MQDVLIETDRLVLRPPTPPNAEAIGAFHQRNHEHLRWTEQTRPDGYHSPESWRERLNDWEREREADTALRLIVRARDAQDAGVIGMVNFSNIVRGPFQACYLGYKLDAAHQGRGLMTEAVGAAVEYAFNHLHLHRVMANYLPENMRGANLLRRLGFTIEGHAQQYLYIDGQWRDHVLTAKMNPLPIVPQ